MDLVISDEQEALAGTVRDWLAARTDLAAAHADPDGGPMWRREDLRAAADLGLVGLLRDAEGGTHTDLALVVAELGYAASPLPLGQAALVCRALDDAGIGGGAADRVAAGSALVVPVLPEPGEDPLRASDGEDGGIVLDGRAAVVVGALGAEAFLVVAGGSGGVPVFALVPADLP